VIRLGAIGDVVRTLPAVSALRAGYPGARISWLVEPGAAALLAAQPWIDEVLEFPRPELVRHARAGRIQSAGSLLRRFVVELRARFDLVLDFTRS
jgi:heptosyltransferase-1